MKNYLSFLFITLFVARVSIPMGERRSYPDVVSFTEGNGFYRLVLFNNKIVFVPSMWTIIEER